MPIKIGNKVYRNIQEQVEKNKEDIETIQKSLPYPSNEYYTKEEANEKFETKEAAFSGDYNDLDNKPELFSGDYDDLTNKPHLYQHNIYIEEEDQQAATFSFINTNPDEMDYDEVREWLYENGFTGGTSYLPASGRCDVDSFEFIDSESQNQYCESFIIAVRATSDDDNDIMFKYSILLEGNNVFGEVRITSEDIFKDTVIQLL